MLKKIFSKNFIKMPTEDWLNLQQEFKTMKQENDRLKHIKANDDLMFALEEENRRLIKINKELEEENQSLLNSYIAVSSLEKAYLKKIVRLESKTKCVEYATKRLIDVYA